jgi:uridine kinase
MKGDTIVVEEHHVKAARGAVDIILSKIEASEDRYAITVGGESGSGKSEIATAIAGALEEKGVRCVILQQDDYFVHPPRTNDLTRRKDISWVGPQEVRLDVLDANLGDFLGGKDKIEKPLVIYAEDRIDHETLDVGGAKVAIAEGTYTTLLGNVNTRVFIDRSYLDTRAHREKRVRHESELDDFVEKVLGMEHEIISAQKTLADIVITRDYNARENG